MNTLTSFCHVIYLLLSVISSLIAYLELSMALVHMNIVRQRIRNNFRQSLMSKDTRKATRRSQPYKQRRLLLLFWTRPGRTSAWWDNFVNEVVVAEEWRENFRMSRRNLSYLWHYLFAFYPVTSQVSRNLTKQGERNEILVNSWQ